MPVQFPPLLALGGEEAFAAYQREFDRLYRSEPLRDPLGRLVLFHPDDAAHVCFKDQPGDTRRERPRIWSPERAARIPWIETALTTPDAIHPSHTMAGRHAYLVEGNLELTTGSIWQRFIVYVEPESARRAQRVRFITAFPPDTVNYWQNVKNKAPRLYPARRR